LNLSDYYFVIDNLIYNNVPLDKKILDAVINWLKIIVIKMKIINKNKKELLKREF
jgi:hypothetical protein